MRNAAGILTLLCLGLTSLCHAQGNIVLFGSGFSGSRIPNVRLAASPDADSFYFLSPLRLRDSGDDGSMKLLRWRNRKFETIWNRPVSSIIAPFETSSDCKTVGRAQSFTLSQDGQRIAVSFQAYLDPSQLKCRSANNAGQAGIEIISPDGASLSPTFFAHLVSPNLRYAAALFSSLAQVRNIETGETVEVSLARDGAANAILPPKLAGVSDDGTLYVVRDGRLVRIPAGAVTLANATTSDEPTDCAEELEGLWQIRAAQADSPSADRLLCVASNAATELWDGATLTKRLVTLGATKAQFATDGKTLLLRAGMAAAEESEVGAIHLFSYDLASGSVRRLAEGTGSVIAADLNRDGQLFTILASGEIHRHQVLGDGSLGDLAVLQPATFTYATHEESSGSVWDPSAIVVCCARPKGQPPTAVTLEGDLQLPQWSSWPGNFSFQDLLGDSYAAEIALTDAQSELGFKNGRLEPTSDAALELPLRHIVTRPLPAAIRAPWRQEAEDLPISEFAAIPSNTKVSFLVRGLGATEPALLRSQPWPDKPRPTVVQPQASYQYFCETRNDVSLLPLAQPGAFTEPGNPGVYRITLQLPSVWPGCNLQQGQVHVNLLISLEPYLAKIPSNEIPATALRGTNIMLQVKEQ